MQDCNFTCRFVWTCKLTFDTEITALENRVFGRIFTPKRGKLVGNWR